MKQTGKELLKLALRLGWKQSRVSGSHHILTKGLRLVVIPVHGSKETPKGLFLRLKKEIEA